MITVTDNLLAEIRNQLRINVEIIKRDFPDTGSKIGLPHTIELLTSHVTDKLTELEAVLSLPSLDFAETLNFYISDSENGISYVPRQKLIEIQDAIRALSAAPASPANGWQHISTAPKDGSTILTWDCDVAHHELARWSASRKLWHKPEWGHDKEDEPPADYDIIGLTVYLPSHWQPLPTPPNGGAV
jgi:hypothetical protein